MKSQGAIIIKARHFICNACDGSADGTTLGTLAGRQAGVSSLIK